MKFSILFVVTALITAILVTPARSASVAQTSFKNIKVLTDMEDNDIRREMQNFGKALGVTCAYCHESSDYASDENPKKDTARKMITMVKTINKDFLGGKASCALCHRGSAIPDAAQ